MVDGGKLQGYLQRSNNSTLSKGGHSVPRAGSPRQEVLTHGPRLLAERLDALEDAQHAVWEIGRDLVLAGTSYAALGRLLGVSAQAARQRFGRHVDAWRDEHGRDVMPWDVDPGYDVELDGADQWSAMHRAVAAARALGG